MSKNDEYVETRRSSDFESIFEVSLLTQLVQKREELTLILKARRRSQKTDAINLAREIQDISRKIDKTLTENEISQSERSKFLEEIVAQVFTGKYREPMNTRDLSNVEET